MISITFESRDKACLKIEKSWFLLCHWVEKNSKMNEKKPEAVVKWCSVKKEFFKI